MALRQVYRCEELACPAYRQTIECWLVVADAALHMQGGGLRCERCGARLRWVLTERVERTKFRRRHTDDKTPDNGRHRASDRTPKRDE